MHVGVFKQISTISICKLECHMTLDILAHRKCTLRAAPNSSTVLDIPFAASHSWVGFELSCAKRFLRA